MKRLQQKVAIVTGAAGGMGAAIARVFAEEGAKVVATDVQVEKLTNWVNQAHSEGLAISALEHDVVSETDWARVVDFAATLYGGVDILVNNAGIYRPLETTEASSLEQWHQVIDTNLTSAFVGVKAALP
jgi:NAD(P)-dependent dehydrogenase (short-subunit alcohol dehydrogenase family)